MVRYFEWMGAAHYTAERHAGAMHGKLFLLDSIYAGIDEANLYGRMDFADRIPEGDFEIVVNLESWADKANRPRRAIRLDAHVNGRRISQYEVSENSQTLGNEGVLAVLAKDFEFKVPLNLLYAVPPQSSSSDAPAASKLRLRISIWQNRLPVDALPVEGWIELQLLPEDEMIAMAK
jgi:hypothetical protein